MSPRVSGLQKRFNLMEVVEDLVFLVAEEIKNLFGEIIENGEVGLIKFDRNDCYILTNIYSLRFLFDRVRIKVSYIDTDENRQLRSYDLTEFMMELSSASLRESETMSEAARNCFTALGIAEDSFWKGEKNWLQENWRNELPEEPMASSLKFGLGTTLSDA